MVDGSFFASCSLLIVCCLFSFWNVEKRLLRVSLVARWSSRVNPHSTFGDAAPCILSYVLVFECCFVSLEIFFF